MGADLDPGHRDDPEARARVAVLRDVAEAERLAGMLAAHGIEAQVEIDDADRALPGQSLLPGLIVAPAPMFAYPVTVALADRAAALRLLRRSAPPRGPSTRALLRGVGIAAMLGAGALALRLALS